MPYALVMRKTHEDPSRKLLIQRITDVEKEARKLRRGRGWGSMEHVLAALVGVAHRNALRNVVLCIFKVQEQFGATEGATWQMPSLSQDALRVFASRKFITLVCDDGTVTVEGDALAEAYEATLMAIARRQIPDNFVPPALIN